ncbi:MAG: FHA domain-containing protein [Deltaproteobacteria bacterium]|nr:FHA domain-containing protein [Deltaproteobacteria bacterium]
MYRLYVLNGSVGGEYFHLKDDVTTIGRAPENDIQIQDHSISRNHARVLRKGDQFLVEDLHSQNGTWIDGNPVAPGTAAPLQENHPFALGNVMVTLNTAPIENGMVTRYAIHLGDGEKARDQLYKDRRITDRDKLEMIQEVSTLLMESLDIDEICGKIMDSLFSSLKRIDSGVILLVDEGNMELKQVIGRSRCTDGGIDVKYSRTIVNRVLQEGSAVMMADTSGEARNNLSESIEALRIKSIMCVPLITKRGPQGLIYVHSVSVPHGFRKDDLFFLTAMSSPAALAIENALLYSRSRQTEEALEKARCELEQRVEERTRELLDANESLKRQIEERERAQQELKKTHDELQEANRNLGIAYTRMREWKDHVSMQLHGQESALLIDEKGRIQGVTEKTVESVGRKRKELLGANVLDLVSPEDRPTMKEEMRKAQIGIFCHTSVRINAEKEGIKHFDVKLMPVNTESGRMLLLLLRLSDAEKGRVQ